MLTTLKSNLVPSWHVLCVSCFEYKDIVGLKRWAIKTLLEKGWYVRGNQWPCPHCYKLAKIEGRL